MTDGHRDPLAERTRGALDAGKPHLGVHAEQRAVGAIRLQQGRIELAGVCHRGVEREGRMPLGEDEAVAILALALKTTGKHGGDQIRDRQRRSNVANPRRIGGIEHAAADRVGERLAIGG